MNRAIAPDIKDITSLHTGFPESKTNLYTIFSEEGVFKLEIVFPSAGYGVVQDKFTGIYALDLLLSGNANASAQQIADAIDEWGGFVFKSCDYYTSSITVYGINENLEKILSIVKSCLDTCVYDEKELDIFKSKKLSELNINLGKTNFLANRRIHQNLFGSFHHFALGSDENSIKAVSSENLVAFRSKELHSPYFIFTGSKNTNIASILEACGFDTKRSRNTESPDPLPAPEALEWFVEKKGSTQNSIRLGKILPSREDPDFFKISLFNLILGGFFGSRLMKNIREEKGLTYGIHSSITPFKTYSLFKISSECNNKLTSEVKFEIEKEIEGLQTTMVGKEELQIAKNYLSGALLRNFDGAFNISARFKTYLELETKENYYQRYFEEIHKTQASDIMECANNYFDIKTLEYCVAGEI